MNRIKKTGILVLTMMLCAAMILTACGGQTSEEQPAVNSNEASYRVSVVDALGNPCADGVIVRFLQGGEQAAMQVVGEDGVAEKTLTKGDYTVELMFTGDEGQYYYDQSDLNLSADKTELQIVLSYTPSAEPRTLTVDGKEYQAYPVTEGGSYVTLIPGERNYFLFTPTTAGTYEFSMLGDAEQIGYYGAPHFVQSANVADVVDNAFTISVNSGMIGTGDAGTTVIVIGIDAGSAENCTLTVERIGDPERSLADEPWNVYEATVALAPYTLASGANLKEFDLTASTDTYNLVLNENDGFYHLGSADGPLVLMLLGEDNQYLDCFKTILEHTGVNRYFFDEAGEFIKKESYTECLIQYIENMDEKKGVYPLTEDLVYIVQQEAEDSGWFDPDNSMYLFQDENGNQMPGINPEIAWLFMCRYTEIY